MKRFSIVTLFAAVLLPCFFMRQTGAGRAVNREANSPFGMCSNANYVGSAEYRAKMFEAGARIARIDASFTEIRPAPGDDPNAWNWTKMKAIARARKENPAMQVLVLLGYSAEWAADPNRPETKAGSATPQRGILTQPAAAPANLYGHYVYETVRRYKNVTSYWESWNEPDLPGYSFFHGSGKDFFPYQKACYLAAKKADPKCKVLFASMCYGNVEGYLALHGLHPPTVAPPTACFFEEYLQACRKDPDARKNNYYFDIMNQHAYSRASDLYDYAAVDRKLMRDYLGAEKPIWMTEMGFPDIGGALGGDADDYCDYILQSYAWGMLAGVEKFFHFQLDNSNGHGLYQGMLGEPKPVLTTYRDVLTREFTGAKFIAQWHGTRGAGFLEGHSAFKPDWKAGYNLFEFRKANGRRLWIAFADTDKPVMIRIPAHTASAVLIDRHNKRMTLKPSAGNYEITLQGATNLAGWPVLPDARAKALGEPEHLVGGGTLVLAE